MRKLLIGAAAFSLLAGGSMASAQELHEDIQGVWRAEVMDILTEEERLIPGTETEHIYQLIEVEILQRWSPVWHGALQEMIERFQAEFHVIDDRGHWPLWWPLR